MKRNIEIKILPNYFLNDDGTFNKDAAIHLDGKIAGICYDKEGFSHLESEPSEKTDRRVVFMDIHISTLILKIYQKLWQWY